MLRRLATRRCLTVALCLLSSVLHAQSVAPQLFSQGDPTSEEQYLLERLNRARLDPVGEGHRLAAYLRLPENDATVTYYHLDPDQISADFARLPAVPPLAFHADLLAAARAHAADLAAHGGQGPNGDGHAGWDGSTPDGRVAASGFTAAEGDNVFAGECAAPQGSNLDEIHAGYLVDWGNPGLGHRQIEMNGDRGEHVVGIGLATSTAPTPFPRSETEDYGMPGELFSHGQLVLADAPALLTGVVYRDANASGFYDVGEGVAGVVVTMDNGAYYTVTGASGGYTLPLVQADGTSADGAVTLHLTNLPGGATREVALSVEQVALSGGVTGTYRANLKWDTVLSPQEAAAAPTDPNRASIAGGGSVPQGGRLTLVVSRPAAPPDRSQPLTFAYLLKGSAVAGVDYQPLSGSVTIPAGKVHARLTVQALDTSVPDRPPGPWTLQLKLQGVKGAQGKASVSFGP